MAYKMIVLLCSLSATPNLDRCDQNTAVDVDIMKRVSPTAERCDHDSRHEQAQIIYKNQSKLFSSEKGAPIRKVKLLCIGQP